MDHPHPRISNSPRPRLRYALGSTTSSLTCGGSCSARTHAGEGIVIASVQAYLPKLPVGETTPFVTRAVRVARM